MKMTLEQFNSLMDKLMKESEDFSDEQYSSAIDMIEAYAMAGHEQCAKHNHVYDKLMGFCMDKGGDEALDTKLGRFSYIKQMFDLGMGIGLELGEKRAIGLKILMAGKGEEDEEKGKGASETKPDAS